MEKIMGALAKVTLGGALTFFFFYSLIVTIALRKSCKTLRNVWYMSACNGILTGHEAKQP